MRQAVEPCILAVPFERRAGTQLSRQRPAPPERAGQPAVQNALQGQAAAFAERDRLGLAGEEQPAEQSASQATGEDREPAASVGNGASGSRQNGA
ncbi:hypothetical protein, partial [Ralstonia solanacearum]|uniref:hypothetical protein n=1 Tax=Ralstonia solanacearum TaxID=305 RepID=UPI0019D405B3